MPTKQKNKVKMIPVAAAEDRDLANQYCDILRKMHIKPIIRRQQNSHNHTQFIIEVPPKKYKQAYKAIALNRSFDPLDDIFLDSDHNSETDNPKTNPYRAA